MSWVCADLKSCLADPGQDQRLMDTLNSSAFKGPIPKFPYVANQFESISLIAGGSGITPMYQIMQEIDSNPSDKTKATLIFGNVTEEDILLRKEFEGELSSLAFLNQSALDPRILC